MLMEAFFPKAMDEMPSFIGVSLDRGARAREAAGI